MSKEHLPGYNLDDDPPTPPTQSPTAEPGGTQQPTLNASDTFPAVTTPPPEPPLVTQHDHDSVTPSVPTADEFSDPKIASLHAIFPDFDATIL